MSNLTSPAIEAFELSRRFGDFVAVEQLNLRVARGEFFGFLGPNGAGKSTTIKMLTGLLAPTGGAVRLLGDDLAAAPLAVKRRIGVVPEDLNLFERLTGAEMLAFTGRMYDVPRAELSARAVELLSLMELDAEPKKLIVEYSHGMKKKLSLACALIHRPEILFLDEPFEGVDAVAARMLKDLLQKLTARGITVFLTSHVLEIVERLCTRLAIISHGKLVAAGSLDELRRAITAEGASGDNLSLEDYFIRVIGGDQRIAQEENVLQWLK